MAAIPRQALLQALSSRIADLELGRPVRLGIDGVDASGKTMLADELVAPLQALGRPVVRASIDGFHRPRSERYQLGRESPEGYYRDSFNLETLIAGLLAPLGPGGSRRIVRAVFDYRLDAAVDLPEESVERNSILVFDGVFLHRPELIQYWDATIYLDVPFDISVLRAAHRDGWPPEVDAVENRRYVEGQRVYLRECNPRALASIVIDNANLDAPVMTSVRAPFLYRRTALLEIPNPD
jgi:uridine kinase